ncbi:hypothetical protein GCM10010384_11800 [Streptomyces djakartensis]|uniref:Uncharacterized protein n=1 Tax=Streptomyces djakartensis TaxID=68193 RepID=A0ABQ2ZC74_9ACTN|nr:hypothetical protein GCM10010384_11800 [Streptomyces djakartensis]
MPCSCCTVQLSVLGVPSPAVTPTNLLLWFTEGAADGFNIMPPHLPGGLEDFVDHVVPILRRRGLFRTEYTGRTLRENHGLARPANRLAATAAGEDVAV